MINEEYKKNVSVIQDINGNNIVVINDIIFRGKDVRDKNSNRFPVFIDLTKIFINGKLLLDENKLISHDKPHKFKLDVIDGEIITLEVEWMPFTNLSKYKF